jgi:hypothetical protein
MIEPLDTTMLLIFLGFILPGVLIGWPIGAVLERNNKNATTKNHRRREPRVRRSSNVKSFPGRVVR